MSFKWTIKETIGNLASWNWVELNTSEPATEVDPVSLRNRKHCQEVERNSWDFPKNTPKETSCKAKVNHIPALEYMKPLTQVKGTWFLFIHHLSQPVKTETV